MLSQEEILTELGTWCKEDLYFFYCKYIASDFREMVDAPHIDTLASYLTDLTKGIINRLCVAMPPRHSKSSMITLAYPLWLLKDDPSLNILIVNNSAGLSEKFGIQLREYVKRIGPQFNLYLSDVKHSSTYLMFTDKDGHLYNGSIRLVGSSGSITGQDADYIILDDVYSGFDDITPSLLAKKIDWFQTIIEQRIEPHTKLVILHTRWHSEDLQGYLHENHPTEYTFLEFPAIDKKGKPLWPERYTIEEYDKKREAMGERLFQAIYQQKPIDLTSDWFKIEHIQWNKPLQDYDRVCRAWDIASSDSTKNNNDSTCGIKAYKTGDYFTITDMVHGQFGEKTKDTIRNTTILDNVEVHQVIETGVAAAGQLLYTEWKDQLRGYIVEQATPVKSKTDRATPLQNAIYDGKVIINLNEDNRDKLLQEFRSFPHGKHDDIVDACAHAYNYLFKQDKSTPQLGVVYL